MSDHMTKVPVAAYDRLVRDLERAEAAAAESASYAVTLKEALRHARAAIAYLGEGDHPLLVFKGVIERIDAALAMNAAKAQDRRELRGCRSCPREWLDEGEGPCPFCGHADTEIRTSFFTEPPSQDNASTGALVYRRDAPDSAPSRSCDSTAPTHSVHGQDNASALRVEDGQIKVQFHEPGRCINCGFGFGSHYGSYCPDKSGRKYVGERLDPNPSGSGTQAEYDEQRGNDDQSHLEGGSRG